MSLSKELLSPPLPPPAYPPPSRPPPNYKFTSTPTPPLTDPEKALHFSTQDKQEYESLRAHEKAVRRILFHTWFGFQFWIVIFQLIYITVWMFLVMFQDLIITTDSTTSTSDSIFAKWLKTAPIGNLCMFVWIIVFIVDLVPVRGRCKIVSETTWGSVPMTVLGLVGVVGMPWAYAARIEK